MIPALADASDVDLTSPWTWAIILAAGFVALCVLIREANRAPVQEAEPSRLDLLDRPHCTVADCREPGVTYLAVGYDDWWLFCEAHGVGYMTAHLRDGVK